MQQALLIEKFKCCQLILAHNQDRRDRRIEATQKQKVHKTIVIKIAIQCAYI